MVIKRELLIAVISLGISIIIAWVVGSLIHIYYSNWGIFFGFLTFSLEFLGISHWRKWQIPSWLPKVALGIVIAIFTTWGLTIVVHSSEEKHIAQGLVYELETIRPILEYDSKVYLEALARNKTSPLPSSSYYDKNGLYYIFGKDLYILDSKTTKELYDLYHNLLKAEDERAYLMNNCFDPTNPKSDIVICDFTMYRNYTFDIHEKILHSTNQIDIIMPLLNNTINQWYAVF